MEVVLLPDLLGVGRGSGRSREGQDVGGGGDQVDKYS